MSENDEMCACCTCGYEWKKGLHGGHNCATYLQKKIDDKSEKSRALKVQLAKVQNSGCGIDYSSGLDELFKLIDQL